MAAALSLGAAFALLTAAATTGASSLLDTRIILALGSGQSLTLLPIMQASSWLASGVGAIPAAILLALVLRRRNGRRDAWLYAGTCFSGWVLSVLLKEATHRVRPMGISPKLTAAGFYSYPSAHVLMAVLVFGFGALVLVRTIGGAVLRRTILGVVASIVAFVAVSRVYLGAHWPTDAIGGLLAGACWAATCVVVARRWNPTGASGRPITDAMP